MYQPTTRLLTVLELLQARPSMSGGELSRRLGVDGRTVRRYVVMLQDMGIPVEAVRGRYGSYRLRPGYKLPPLMFTEEEALAVAVGLLLARRLGLTAAAPATEGALAKLERVLPVAVSERIRALEETLAITQGATSPAPAGDVVLTLSAAVQLRQRVWLRYRSAGGGESEREFDPYGVVFHYGRWYLAGLDHRSGAMRVFRVDRILEAQPKDATFLSPTGFDPIAQVRRSLADIPWEFEIEVRLDTTVDRVLASLPGYDAHLQAVPDGVILRTGSDDLSVAARFLVNMGFPFTVLSPLALREEVRRLGESLVERHSDGFDGRRSPTPA